MSLNQRMKNVLGLNSKSASRRKARSLLGKAVRTAIDTLETRQLLTSASPVANLGGPYSVNEGSSIVIDGGQSTDDVAVTAYGWDLNYHASKGFRRSVTGKAFTFQADDGNATRPIALRVIDADGNMNIQTGVITINDVAPTVTLTGNSAVDEGTPYSLAWTSTDPGQDTISGYSIDWGDGVTTTHAANVSNTTHTYASDDNYTISFTAIDEDGSHVTTKNLTVNNVAPIINSTLTPTTANEGSQVRVNYSSPNRGSTIDQWIVDWGDDSVNVRPGASTNSTHTYADNGNYTVTITALEVDGTATDHTMSIVINNVAPVATLGGVPNSSPEGTQITATSAVTDAGVNDTFTYAWELKKDGNVIGTSTTAGNYVFTPADNGSYSLKLTVTDNNGASDIETKAFTVTNVAPTGTVTATIPGTFNEGDSVTFTNTIVDPGSLDTQTRDWRVEKNGVTMTLPSPQTGATFTFTPTDEGSYVVSCLITDKDGGQYVASYSSTITVLNVAPTATVAGGPATTTSSPQALGFTSGGFDSVNDSGTLSGNTYEYAGDDSVHQQVVVLKYAIPNGTTAADVAGASLTIRNFHNTTPPLNLYTFTSASSTVVGGDYAAYVSTRSLVTTAVFANGTPATISGTALENAIKAAIANGDSYVSFAIGNAATTSTGATDDVMVGQLGGPYTPPALTIGGGVVAGHSNEGTAQTFTATAHDAGADDVLAYAWTVTKNGTPVTLSPSVTSAATLVFTPTDNGTYIASVTVTDGDGGTVTTAGNTFIVDNVAPTATLAVPTTGLNEGSALSFSTTASDVGTDDTFTYAWSVQKNGSPFTVSTPTNAAAFTFTPDNEGSYVVSVVVSDDDGGSVTKTSSAIIVANVAPTATISAAPVGAVEGDTISLTSTHVDPGAADVFTYLWTATKNGATYNFPPGTPNTASNLDFVADDNGDYVVTLVITDDAGAHTSATRSFSVANSDPVATISGTPGSAINEGDTIALTTTVADAGVHDTFSYLWSVKKGGVAIPNLTGNTSDTFNYVPRDNGTYVISVKVTDNDGGTHTTDTTAITVNNVAPTTTVTGTPGAPVNEGAALSFVAHPADAGADDTFTYAWSVTKDGNAYTPASNEPTDGANFDFAPNDNGSYIVSVVVTDDDNASVTYHSNAFTVNNVAPTATASGPTTGNEGSLLTFTSTKADAGSADTHTYAWTVTKNGSPYTLPGGVDVTQSTLAFTPDDNGTYVASVTVTDDDLASVTANATATVVANVAPTATVSGPTTGFEASPLTFTSTHADVGTADTFTYAWSVTKNGATYNTGATLTGTSLTFTPDDNGTYIATLVVTDDDLGAVTVHAASTIVANVDPTGTASGPTTGTEGSPLTFTGTKADVSSADTTTYLWTVKKDGANYNIGSAVNNAASFTFTPNDNGTYIASLTVTDDDGGHTTIDATPTIVTNVAPTGTLSGMPLTAVNEGSVQSFTATVSDVGTADTFSYAWTVTKDGASFQLPGTVATNASVFAFTPNDNGTYAVACVVSDDDNGTVTLTSTPFTVLNVAPTATANGPTTGNEGSPLTFTSTKADVGSADTHTYLWSVTRNGLSYNIGNATATNPTFTFTPNDDGLYVASVAVTDDDNGTGSAAAPTTVVSNVAPTAVITGAPTSSIVEGSTVTVGTTVTDPGTADTQSYVWSVKRNGVTYDISGSTNGTSGFSFAPNDQGTYVLSVTVTDKDNAATTTTKTITVTNGAPTGSFTTQPASSISQGTQATYTVTAQDPSPVDTLSYVWQVTRNGVPYTLPNNYVPTGATLVFTPTLVGTYGISTIVSDNDGAHTPITTTTSVTNVAPTISAIHEANNLSGSNIAKGTEFTYTADVTDPGSEPLTYGWTILRNGSVFDTDSGTSFDFTPTLGGTYQVQLTVGDGIALANATVPDFTVINNAPSIDALHKTGGATEGSTLGYSADVSDLDATDTLTYAWELKLGNTVIGTATTPTFSHVVAGDGTYSMKLTVSDGETTTTQTESVVVTNVAPTATISSVTTGAFEGGNVTLVGTGADAGNDAITYLWQIRQNGSDTVIATATTATMSFTPTNPGSYTATLKTNDGTVDSSLATSSFSVANSVPTGNVLTPTLAGVVGWDQKFSIENLYAYSGDTVSVDWNWGDSTTTTGVAPTAAQTHRFYNTGTYQVKATFHDEDGGSSIATQTFIVNDFGMQIDPMGDGTAQALVVQGNGDNDAISFSQNGNGTIKAVRNGNTLGSTFSATRIYSNGDGGQNSIVANANVTIPVVFVGGSSRDTLSGGSGNDILMGRRGNDSLIGGAGRDFLIGGLDNDTLSGAAGEDIVAGGSQTYSEDWGALKAIMGEWSNTSRTFSQRVTRLRNGADGLAAYFATGTVINDNKTDVLSGGADTDWMFKDLGSAPDNITDSVSPDRVDTNPQA